MSKQIFMAELKQLLGDLPVAEREEALSYYEDYFADAGEENEDSVIAELESPEKVAFTIKTGLADENKSEGEFTDSGFKGYEDPYKDEIINTIPESEQRGFKNNTKNNLVLFILILIVLSPIILAGLGSLIGILAGLAGAALGIICAVAGIGIACLVAGAIIIVVAIINFSAHLMGSVILAGLALMLLGLGGLLLEGGIKIITKLFPLVIRTIIALVKNAIQAINRRRRVI